MSAAPKFTIEKGVPLPIHWGRGAPAKYPFNSMEVGDSFFVAGGTRERNALRTAASWAGKRATPRKRYAIRKVDGGYRCWRVE